MEDVLELPQPLVENWVLHTSNKSGRKYYVHSTTGESRWETPHDTFEKRQWTRCMPKPTSACADGAKCLLNRDVYRRDLFFEFLERMVYTEFLIQVDASNANAEGRLRGPLVQIGCGRENNISLFSSILSSSPPPEKIYIWETANCIGKNKLSSHLLHEYESKKVFEQFAFDPLDAATGLPPQAVPVTNARIVLCRDILQCCWDTASHARRMLRKICALLHPQEGVALCFLPDARMIMENTANGCTAFVRREGEAMEAEGAHWPSDSFSRIVYGARYAHRACMGQRSRLQWLVSRPTLEHASAATGLSVVSMCNAVTFLSWLGIGQGQLHARRARAEAAWTDLILQCGAISAHDWESIRFWAIAVLVPRSAEGLAKLLQSKLPND